MYDSGDTEIEFRPYLANNPYNSLSETETDGVVEYLPRDTECLWDDI